MKVTPMRFGKIPCQLFIGKALTMLLVPSYEIASYNYKGKG